MPLEVEVLDEDVELLADEDELVVDEDELVVDEDELLVVEVALPPPEPPLEHPKVDRIAAIIASGDISLFKYMSKTQGCLIIQCRPETSI